MANHLKILAIVSNVSNDFFQDSCTAGSVRYATGLNVRPSANIEREIYGTLSTIPIRVAVPPNARHIESRPFESSLS